MAHRFALGGRITGRSLFSKVGKQLLKGFPRDSPGRAEATSRNPALCAAVKLTESSSKGTDSVCACEELSNSLNAVVRKLWLTFRTRRYFMEFILAFLL